jgi:hypothetical protein
MLTPTVQCININNGFAPAIRPAAEAGKSPLSAVRMPTISAEKR